MSVFDPEKVKRGHIDLTGDEFVLAKDFDKLLALCRLQREIIEKVAAPAVQREYDRLPEDVKAISDALYKQYVESLEGIKL
jgi:hypothetical protein